MENRVGLDCYRLLAAFLVIAIHTSPLLSLNENADFFLTRIFARMAVPLFLMITGYYVAVKFWEEEREPSGSLHILVRFLKKIALLYGISIMLYLPVGLYAGRYKEITVAGIFRMLIFDGTFYHLWYFPACMLGMVILWICSRCSRRWMEESKRTLGEDKQELSDPEKKEMIGFQRTMLLTVILYAFGLLGDSYYGLTEQIPVLKKLYDGIFHVFSYTRNGIFLAPLFLMLGVWIAQVEARITAQEMGRHLYEIQLHPVYIWNRRRAGTGLLISLALMTVEGFILHKVQWQRHDSMYVMLPFVMLFLYIWICAKPQQPSPQLRKLSTWIYILHPAVIVVVHALPGGMGKLAVGNSLINYVLVAVGTTILSAAGMLLWKKMRNIQKKE